MFRKFISGLLFGSGFMVAAIIFYTVWILWIWPLTIKMAFPDSELVESAPEVEQSSMGLSFGKNNYLGIYASYSGDFDGDSSKILASGPGEIVGNATISGNPAAGLKVRLALNGEVMSQWGEVDDEGHYAIKVPYGKYREDGFEIDSESANSVLAGKILHPGIHDYGNVFDVSENSNGKGVDFNFIDPVKVYNDKKSFSNDEDIIIKWEPYPGASEYVVQVSEIDKPYHVKGDSRWFKWRERPKVKDNSIDLRQLGHTVKPGYYYIIEIEALNDKSEVISESPWTRAGYDIYIKDS